MNESLGRRHVRGVIESVTGRANGRGVPEVSEAVLRLEDGSTLEVRMPRPVGTERKFQALPVAFEFVDFGVCPICLAPEPRSREHVPPHSVGGSVVTMSCETCNNEFGSKYEPHLRNWYENTIGKVRLSGKSVPGRRSVGEYLLRENASGGFVLFQHGKHDPAVSQILGEQGFEMSYEVVDTTRSHIAAVKTAYLASCVALRAIPQTPRADALRAELLAARDMPRDQRAELGDVARSIKVARSAHEPNPGEIVLMAAADEQPESPMVISFNRVFAVDWPLDPITGFTRRVV
ncbi:HNH endonuclease [Microbacterium paraoxydans]|uniref:HNH endonuclease n=1 Tax=Microbacterium paraoxydans TaxID=199592 RepID=UPI001CFB3BE4|nr:HNH endonuclease [Microbacterium paraoxydans]